MRFGKFNMVGLLGAAVQVVTTAVLTWLGMRAVAAAAIAVELAVLHNFFWHQRLTWRDRPMVGGTFGRLWRFHAANGAVSMAGNIALMYFLVERLKLPAVPSSGVAILVCAAINFRLADRWVFRNQAPRVQ